MFRGCAYFIVLLFAFHSVHALAEKKKPAARKGKAPAKKEAPAKPVEAKAEPKTEKVEADKKPDTPAAPVAEAAPPPAPKPPLKPVTTVKLPAVLSGATGRPVLGCAKAGCKSREMLVELPERALDGEHPLESLQICAENIDSAKERAEELVPGLSETIHAFFGDKVTADSFVVAQSCAGSMCEQCPKGASVLALQYTCKDGTPLGVKLECTRPEGKYESPPEFAEKCAGGAVTLKSTSLAEVCTKSVQLEAEVGVNTQVTISDDSAGRNSITQKCEGGKRCNIYGPEGKWVKMTLPENTAFMGTQPGWCVNGLPLSDTKEACPCKEGYSITFKENFPLAFGGRTCSFKIQADKNYTCQTSPQARDLRLLPGIPSAERCSSGRAVANSP